ncbi:UsfY protein [Mycolicibacterium chitae]|uniref:UsfY protein n=2 Tax=Mycobacteriaceae TaxID=1762 RepID=A0A3S4SAP3_MYCCI|nr:protein UsfY [Mycolicibacterium chitae]MCV7105433.1 hypothetical protein [Mycolicibacterium chitae]BBZ05247.1 UsfY protein [Mycolicibacterium chitae]VEG48866.1 UsfY protein [Mycolicibacterium chitae]
MGDTHHDPTDHFRTTNQHAGEHMIDVYFWPGLFLLVMGAAAVIGAVASAAYGHSTGFALMAPTAVGATIVGALWIGYERRRVRRIEARWLSAHPGHPRVGIH